MGNFKKLNTFHYTDDVNLILFLRIYSKKTQKKTLKYVFFKIIIRESISYKFYKPI